MFFALLAFVLSAAFLAVMITALVLLRKGEGPRYSASRAYDASRREAVRTLLGAEVDRVPGTQWFDPARKAALPDEPLRGEFDPAVGEALQAVVPSDRGLAPAAGGAFRLEAEDAWVVPAISTAELRAGRMNDRPGRLVIGLVLFNPEPPGGEATRVALPVQVLFPALTTAGREDLVRRFEEIRARATRAPATTSMERGDA